MYICQMHVYVCICSPIANCEHFSLLASQHVIQRAVNLPILLVMNNGMAVAESASLHILSAETHMVAFYQKSSKGQSFSGGPVHSVSCLYHLASLLIDSLYGFVWAECGRKCGNSFPNFLQYFQFNPVERMIYASQRHQPGHALILWRQSQI